MRTGGDISLAAIGGIAGAVRAAGQARADDTLTAGARYLRGSRQRRAVVVAVAAMVGIIGAADADQVRCVAQIAARFLRRAEKQLTTAEQQRQQETQR